MTEYLPQIFNVNSLLIGLFLFAKSLGIFKPKTKPDDNPKKQDTWLEKYKTTVKIISVILIIKGIYGLLYPNPDNYKLASSKDKRGWERGAKSILDDKCIKNTGQTAINYPRITKEYCECSNEKIMNNYTEDQYLVITKKSIEIQSKELLPKFQDCLDELKRRIDSTDKIRSRIELQKQKDKQNSNL